MWEQQRKKQKRWHKEIRKKNIFLVNDCKAEKGKGVQRYMGIARTQPETMIEHQVRRHG